LAENFNKLLVCVKIFEIWISTCEDLSIVPTIRLLLQTQNIRLTLCNYSSIVDILKYKIEDNQTSFLKINKYFGIYLFIYNFKCSICHMWTNQLSWPSKSSLFFWWVDQYWWFSEFHPPLLGMNYNLSQLYHIVS
jgi:hypothetical protein